MKVRIIPSQTNGRVTTGTRVVLEDGTDLPGVTKITLVADVDALWLATIECLAAPGEVDAEATIAKTPVNAGEEKAKALLRRIRDSGAWFTSALEIDTHAGFDGEKLLEEIEQLVGPRAPY